MVYSFLTGSDITVVVSLPLFYLIRGRLTITDRKKLKMEVKMEPKVVLKTAKMRITKKEMNDEILEPLAVQGFTGNKKDTIG